MNTIGHNLKLTVYGESHGKSIGAVLDGLPPGEYLDWDEVKKEMARRAPGKNTLSRGKKAMSLMYRAAILIMLRREHRWPL